MYLPAFSFVLVSPVYTSARLISYTYQSCLYIYPSYQLYLSVLSIHLPVLSGILISPVYTSARLISYTY